MGAINISDSFTVLWDKTVCGPRRCKSPCLFAQSCEELFYSWYKFSNIFCACENKKRSTQCLHICYLQCIMLFWELRMSKLLYKCHTLFFSFHWPFLSFFRMYFIYISSSTSKCAYDAHKIGKSFRDHFTNPFHWHSRRNIQPELIVCK